MQINKSPYHTFSHFKSSTSLPHPHSRLMTLLHPSLGKTEAVRSPYPPETQLYTQEHEPTAPSCREPVWCTRCHPTHLCLLLLTLLLSTRSILQEYQLLLRNWNSCNSLQGLTWLSLPLALWPLLPLAHSSLVSSSPQLLLRILGALPPRGLCINSALHLQTLLRS